MSETIEIRLVSFLTDLGWMGLALRGGVVQRLKFGHPSEPQLIHSFAGEFESDFKLAKADRQVSKWRTALQRFASGRKQDLSSIAIDLESHSPFHRKVLKLCRNIGYGDTITYGQLAGKAGSPNAARAVGTAMKRNRVPLIVPCHRVIASNGVGGYSAVEGVSSKVKLLKLEGVQF